jgi:hypothetical protein
MGCCFSSTASVDSAPALGASNPLSAATHPASASSQRRTQAPPDALVSSVASASTGLPRIRPHTAAAHGRQNTRSPLLDLPRETIWQIADELQARDIKEFADTCQSLRCTLAEHKRSAMLIARLTARARQVRTPDESIGLLHDIQIGISRPHLRATPLASLITTIYPARFVRPLDAQQSSIWGWSDNARTELFDSIWAATLQVPPEARSTPVEMLVTKLAHLPAPERTTRFDTLLNSIAPLSPQHRSASLESLAPALLHLPDIEQRSSRIDAVLHTIAQLPPEHRAGPLAALARQFPYLHPTRHQAVYDAVLEHVPQLPAERRGRLLTMLAPFLSDLPEPEAQFGALIEAIRQLPAQDLGPALSALAPFIDALPENDQLAAFERAMQLIEQLAPQQRTLPLQRFAQQIHGLPDPARTAASDSLWRVNGGHRDIDTQIIDAAIE